MIARSETHRDRTATSVGLLLYAFFLAMPVDSSAAEKGPSAQSVLDEVIMLVQQYDIEYELVKIAVRQAKLQSCHTANDLFRTASNWNERQNLEIDRKISFLDRLVAHQRIANCRDEMHETAHSFVALYQQRYQDKLGKDAGDEEAITAHTLQFHVERGTLYVLMEDWDRARAIVPPILEALQPSKWQWRPEGPNFPDAVMFLARLGHDKQALEIVAQYDSVFESRPGLKEDYLQRMWWIYRIATVAAVAEGQAKAGHQEAARKTLRRAIDKVRETPVKRLTELYGESARPSLGEGEALQSAGAMGIAARAAHIGETALALEAFKLTAPVANDPFTTWALLVALTQTGQIEQARHILDNMKCKSQAIAQGLLEKHDWYGALQEEQAYQHTSSRERDCDVSSFGGREYVTGLGKARTFVEGDARALAWARKQDVYTKVDALLGIVDALIERESGRANGK